ncbi:LPXTG-motif cell wall anchor domain-containing protein/fimbrial isopeptide formation D2 domain-containing protein [Granulicatella balaenopterae]|uniref:LPXTG-motif cell wall anchor domain-containing protein/fimbrial isopeptide formation D2 domain-containing protein n=1 Tax=Granulicatella balaenopterae TaxID=137733 RepID=A0A1H9N0E1_9LACT|nr:SpaH/EbpB family LPXTG-anchored major pilin [Granulicatella balaenopterae]SER28803.1 LPXTG-motif cell wall anchor domain-containing protein/fimbrial isopeptide formation D2 domain-containing protein [Granulicatella balaenopterae]
MKKFTKFLSVFMTAIMTLGMILPNMAFAAATKTNTVWVHKVLMQDQKALDQWTTPEGYDATQDFEGLQGLATGTTLEELAGVYFAVQNADGQFIDANGNALGATLEEAEAKGTVLGGLTTANGLELNTTNLPQDVPTEYKIVENLKKSTYVGPNGETLTSSHVNTAPIKLTLPLVNDKGVQETIHLYPKNTKDIPKIDKNFAEDEDLTNIFGRAEDIVNPGKGAQYPNYDKAKGTISRNIGDVVKYDVLTYIPYNAKYEVLKWQDTMTAGLTYNQDVVITSKDGSIKFTKDTDYTLEEVTDRGFKVVFTQTGLEKVKAEAAKEAAKTNGFEIRFKYSATVNEDAIVDKADENDIKFEYGNNPDVTKELNPTEPKVITYGKKFVKTDSAGTDTDHRLDGAEFAVKNEAGEYLTFDGKKYGTTTNVDEAYKLTSANGGLFEIKGLEKGTYYLEETVAPEGFAKLTGTIEFEVGPDTYTTVAVDIDWNLEDADETPDALRVINKKISIPQTGGIGTAIFVIAGIALMGGAFVAMKRQEA